MIHPSPVSLIYGSGSREGGVARGERNAADEGTTSLALKQPPQSLGFFLNSAPMRRASSRSECDHLRCNVAFHVRLAESPVQTL